MHISLVDSQTIKLVFRYAAPTVAYIKTLSGAEYDGKTKTWTVNLSVLRKLIDKYPYAMIEEREQVIAARLALWRRWVQAHNAMGVWFALDPDDCETVVPVDVATGRVYGEGESITGEPHILVEAVAQRSAILRQFLGDQMTLQNRPDAYRHGVPACMPSDGDRLIWTGIQNAKLNEEKREEMTKQRQAKRYKAKRPSAVTDGRSLGGKL